MGLTEDQLRQIEEYNSESIKTLEDFMEAVRKTIGQYLGYKGTRGWLNALRELIQNALDELSDPNSFGTYIKIFYDAQNKEFEIMDNGRGIPFDDIERIYASEHTSKNYEKTESNYSSGTHGIGAKATNAVSSVFIATSYRNKKSRQVEFHNGTPVKQGKIINDKTGLQGTRVQCKPHECLGEIKLSCAQLIELIESIVPLYKIGTKVLFKGIELDGSQVERKIENIDGLMTYLVRKTDNPLIVPIVVTQDTGSMKVDIAFTWDGSQYTGDPDVDSFANYCPTIGGSHLDGFLNGIVSFFRSYMNNIYLVDVDKSKKKKDLRIIGNDIKTGLKGIVHGLHLYPTFTSQAKEFLSNEDIKVFLEQNIPKWLEEWTKKSPNDFKKLCKFFKDVAEIRMSSEAVREKIVNKYKANRITNMPEKFLPPNDWNSDQLELIIEEGDSAFGSYKNARYADTQGLFPIRGKFINALTNAWKKVKENEEVQALITIIGGGVGKSFDITRVRWRRIIIATDADIDGYHIRTLLMKFFLTYMPDLITSGKIFLAIPPLYGMPTKSGKIRYFTTMIEYINFVKSSFIKSNTISYGDGRHIAQTDLSKILYDNANYVDEMNKIAYAINPDFLEFILLHRNLDSQTLVKVLKQEYRFLESITETGNTRIIKALVNQKIQTVFLGPRFIQQCAKVIAYIDKGYQKFLVNGNLTGLYGLMNEFNKFKPSRIFRYKGLGEMNPEQLAESTLYPSATRRLMVYTVNELNSDIEEIRYLESNKQELLKSITV